MWRIAECLLVLRGQINAAYPGRDKSSDGAIGDAAHATRASDHNPWVKDGKIGIVTAIDIDEDLSASIRSLGHVIDAICVSKDPRVKYIIYEGRITVKGTQLQQWKKYTGANAHKHHAHISVQPDKRLYDSTRPWLISAPEIIAVPTSDPEQHYIVAKGDTLSAIARKFATSWPEIMRLNDLKSTVIGIGQTLRVR